MRELHACYLDEQEEERKIYYRFGLAPVRYARTLLVGQKGLRIIEGEDKPIRPEEIKQNPDIIVTFDKETFVTNFFLNIDDDSLWLGEDLGRPNAEVIEEMVESLLKDKLY